MNLDIIKLNCSGIFQCKEIELKSDFTLYYFPSHIRMVTNQGLSSSDIVSKKLLDSDWTLLGMTSDNIKMECGSLILVSVNEDKAEFIPRNSGLYLGTETDATIESMEFPLIGFYRGTCSLKLKGWSIDIFEKHNEGINQERLSKIWGIPLEGLSLRLQNKRVKTSGYLDQVLVIRTMLSLASGNDVKFNRQVINYSNGSKVEIWREFIGYEFGAKICIPFYRTADYLKQCLPLFKSTEKSIRKKIGAAISYINSTSNGYLDDRILRITQAWELLADQLVDFKFEISQPRTEFKRALKSTLKAWRDKYPGQDPEGFLGTRVIESLEYDKAIEKLTGLAKAFNLNFEKIGLDFPELIKLRNNVAHTGFMKTKKRPVELLESSRFGLQILILRYLNYKGELKINHKGWSSFASIHEFLDEDAPLLKQKDSS